MGHDIFAIKTDDTKGEFPNLKKDVACLRRSCFSEDKALIYRALNAMKHYGLTSGRGTWEFFDKTRLEKALDILTMYPDQRKFVENCLKNLDETGKIAIVFI